MTLPTIDDDRFLHEPRALWTVQRVEAPAPGNATGSMGYSASGRVLCPKDDFRNGGRYPITLTHMLACAVGYTYRELSVDEPNSTINFQNCMSALNLTRVLISAPYSRYYTRRDLPLSGFQSCPASEPGMDNVVANPPAINNPTTETYASGLWGLSRWDFDRPLYLPRKAIIQMDLGAYSMPNVSGGGAPETVTATFAFDELHTGIFGGNNRVREREVQTAIAPANAAVEPLIISDAFTLAAGNPSGPLVWPPSGFFRPKLWNEQESNRGQLLNHYKGFAIAIDQIEYDLDLSALSAFPVAPLSTRIPVRARVATGGSGEWWWQPGAPIALVAPTIGPALVQKLDVPIVLGPGEQLEVEVQVPNGIFIPGEEQPTTIRPTYNVGLSFTGYASIEGP